MKLTKIFETITINKTEFKFDTIRILKIDI